MRTRNTSLRMSVIGAAALVCALAFQSETALAQSSQYQRKKAPAPKGVQQKGKKAKAKKSDKLDITDLEQKYWAPKDTDFSVVQNRTYSKNKRFSANFLYGPFVNETFSTGQNLGLGANYYFNERHGVELMYFSSNTKNSKTTNVFRDELGGGGVGPDYNMPTDAITVSYNWVPFYAKMSVLGKRIIYFDMQFSPGLAFSNYDQIIAEDPLDAGNKNFTAKSKSSVGFAFDVTQFFFISKHIAIRADLRNRWYKQEVLGYQSGTKQRSETANTTMFLMGVTYFF